MNKKYIWSLLALFPFVVSCGGTTPSASNPPPVVASAKARVFAIDDMNTGYDHVWVTIEKIVLINATDNSLVTIFDRSAQGGKTIDLSSLHDGSGALFELINGFDALTGSYSGAIVTVDSQLVVFPTNATTGIQAVFSGATGTTIDLSLTFAAPQTLGSDSNLVIDFDLANWNLDLSATPLPVVSAPSDAFLASGSSTGISDNHRHVDSEHEGTLSGLLGDSPNQTFTIADEEENLDVATDSSTIISNSDGSSGASLANGQRVEVRGSFDTTNNIFRASSVTIIIGDVNQDGLKVCGTVNASDSTGGTLIVTPSETDGFIPTSSSVSISTDSNTVYLDANGSTEDSSSFFQSLVLQTTVVCAHGTQSGDSILANRISIQAPESEGDSQDATLSGTVSNVVLDSGTFDLTLTSSDGVTLDNGTVVHVVVGDSTEYKLNGADSDAATLFAALSADSIISAEGSYDPTTQTLTASSISFGSEN